MKAQITAIPNTSFERRLIDLHIDSDGIVNGQVFTVDIENVTELKIEDCFWMTDITGIEGFKNLEKLTVSHTMITSLNLSQNLKLKELHCGNNSLQALDVSANTQLRVLHTGNYACNVEPMNYISEIDLSANPYVKIFSAYNMLEFKRLNLKNRYDNSNVKLYLSYYPDDPVSGNANHVCIEVDDATLAQANMPPYSHWQIDHSDIAYGFSENCTLDAAYFKKASVMMYPNPVSDILYITSSDTLLEIDVYTIPGQKIKSFLLDGNDRTIDVSALAAGNYLVAVKTEKGTTSQKLIIK